MAKIAIKKASTDVTLYLFIQDSSVTTGAGKTGLAYNTGSLTAYYVRPLGSATAITLATQTVTGAHSDGGFVEVDATNMPGLYRLDLPDAVCATGVNSVVVMMKGATGMAPVPAEIQLTDFDLNTAFTSALVADAVWDEATADHTTATTFGALDANVDSILADTGTDGVLVSSGTGAKQISLDAGKVLLQATQTGVTIPTVTTLTNAPTGMALEATLTAIKGAGWTTETLAAIDALIDAIKAKTDNLPASPANEATLTAIKGAGWTNENLTTIDANVDAIKLKTDNLPSDPADQSAVEAAITAGIGTIPAGITAEDVMTAIVEGAITLRDSLKLANAMNAGKLSGGNTNTIKLRDLADTLDRIIMTVDVDGNRSNVAKDYS